MRFRPRFDRGAIRCKARGEAVPLPTQPASETTPQGSSAIANELAGLPVQPAVQLGIPSAQYSPGSSGSPVPTPGQNPLSTMPTGGTPGLTPQVSGSVEATRTLTPTPTRPPTSTPYLTPTPTASSTPTITPTPAPPPPWVYTRLTPSDPRSVVLASGKPQLVMFYAYWSGPSQAMSPIVQSLATEFEDQVLFTYLDIDDPATEALKKQLNFKIEPQFFLLNGQGQVIHQWTGSVPAEELRNALAEAANS
jgi:thiol-disulfide isomerase/thioredoxin